MWARGERQRTAAVRTPRKRRTSGEVMGPQPKKDSWTPGTMHILDHERLTYRHQGRSP